MINESHFHDIRPFGKKWLDLNLTHTINQFYFGVDEGREPGQLTGFTSVQEKKGYWRVVYMTDVMGDDYTSERYIIENSTSMYPGVSVEYDISPIYALEYREHETLLQLLTKMVISAGGVVFMFRVIDATLYANDAERKLAD